MSATAAEVPGRVPGVLLEVDGLTVEFATPSGSVTVVEDVGFHVGAGETLGIVGESGCGKTVTSLAVMGLLPPRAGRVTSGSIRFGDRDLARLRAEELRQVRGKEIAMIFQEPMTSLNPAFTVGNQIAEVLRTHLRLPRKVARARAVELLDLVGIPDPGRRVGDYPHAFSGGMRQRVMVAMALACGPRLLIADEPTTALDVTVQAQILDLLHDLQRELGMAVVFVTHDLGVVADICHRVAVMYAGQVVEEAAVDDLFARPTHPYTEGLLVSMPRTAAPGADLHVIPGQVPRPGEVPPGCRFAPRCAYATGACSESPVPLAATGHSQQTRCLRHAELVLRGAG